MKLLYPTSLVIDATKLRGLGVDAQPYDVTKPIAQEHTDAEVLVTWSNTPGNLKDANARLKNIKWIQSLAAGPNDVLNAGFGKDVIVTTGSGLHDYTVSEHALALLLSAARSLHLMRDSQLKSQWPQHLGGPQPDRPKGKFTSLKGSNVLIWGYGNIAKTLAPHLKALGANVRGIARSARSEDGVEVLTENDLPKVLPQTDALVMILPGSASTKHALNAERLKLLPKHAWIINVGRGTSIDEDALADAAETHEIGGAALDVFEREPLPETSRFWKMENIIISPHAAGGRPQGAEELIAENLKRFQKGQSMKNIVDH